MPVSCAQALGAPGWHSAENLSAGLPARQKFADVQPQAAFDPRACARR
jgi:hypothetical protein